LEAVDRSSLLTKSGKTSSENWIPEEVRMRSLYREFQLLKENLGDIRKREDVEKVNMKALSVSDLARAQVKESLGATKKVPCGCCLRKYLDVNLPLKVSHKAIMDIRIKWSASLSSATVFGGDPVVVDKKDDEGVPSSSTGEDDENAGAGE